MQEEMIRFLRAYPPFSLLPLEKVRSLADYIEYASFAAGQDILIYGGEPARSLYIVHQGSVNLLREDEHGQVTLFDTLGAGEVFGHPSLIRDRAPDVTVRCREETQTYLLPAETFHQLRHAFPDFSRFFDTSSLERLLDRLRNRDDLANMEFRARLRDILQPAQVYVSPDTSVQEAARMMRENDLPCVIVNSSPPGIVTDLDLRNRVLADGLSYNTPVSQLMSSPILTMPGDSLVFEGLLAMLERRIRHLPIVEHDKVVGVITHSDILRQQSQSPLLLPRQLSRARDMEDIKHYAEQVTRTVGALLDAGARLYDIGRVVAVAHDALLERLLQDAEADLGEPPCPYAWLVLGSEGRYEQTVRTDQDNALIYDDQAPRGAEGYFARLTERIVGQLVECGFPRCPGDIMASNPRWRRPLQVWQHYFDQWIHVPDEEALMRVAIFFDFRRVYGTMDIEQGLRPLVQEARKNGIFLSRLSKGALRQSPPISFFRGLVVEHDGAGHEVIDLKERGTALIVDLARLFGLAAGVTDTNTINRLRQAAPQSDLSKDGAEELIAAFELISLFRLRHQYHQIERGEQPDNKVPVSELSHLEQRELKEALRAVGRIQSSARSLFGTSWMG